MPKNQAQNKSAPIAFLSFLQRSWQKLPASEGQEFFEASEAVYAAFKALRPAFPSPAKPELSAALPFFSELCRRLSLHPNRPFKHLIFSTKKGGALFVSGIYFLDNGKSSFCISAFPLLFSVGSPLGRVSSRSLLLFQSLLKRTYFLCILTIYSAFFV